MDFSEVHSLNVLSAIDVTPLPRDTVSSTSNPDSNPFGTLVTPSPSTTFFRVVFEPLKLKSDKSPFSTVKLVNFAPSLSKPWVLLFQLPLNRLPGSFRSLVPSMLTVFKLAQPWNTLLSKVSTAPSSTLVKPV